MKYLVARIAAELLAATLKVRPSRNCSILLGLLPCSCSSTTFLNFAQRTWHMKQPQGRQGERRKKATRRQHEGHDLDSDRIHGQCLLTGYISSVVIPVSGLLQPGRDECRTPEGVDWVTKVSVPNNIII